MFYTLPVSETLFEVRRRTFDTPHFRGIEFIEVEAKSIINKVPGNYLPFSHTINPYRGCSHACSYCVSGDTRVLMADCRTKPISEVRVGDEIYGTEFDGKYRRYVKTQVSAHWSSVKPAYRITLADGTGLIASADHRFLTKARGWKYVTGEMSGQNQRPYLTTNNELLGTGKFAEHPERNLDYMQGYLCGMIRGDGHLAVHRYKRAGRKNGDIYQFRLALKDFEALRRTQEFLRAWSIETSEFLFLKASGNHNEMRGIRTQRRAHFDVISEVIAWPADPSREWTKGFLAGIFDAEGSYSTHILRISSCDPELIGQIATAFTALGFRRIVEEPRLNKPFANVRPTKEVQTVRLLGGLEEVVRFFHTVDPAITRKRSIEGHCIKNDTDLRVVSIAPLGIDLPMYDMTTGTGDFIANGVVSHNCFARSTHTYMDMNAGRDFETKIVVKVNAVELLRRELLAKKWTGDHIAMGTATDPYQRAEGRYRLMSGIISTLTEFRNPFSILTKGTLILRDLELLVEASKVTHVAAAMSIPTLDSDVWRRSEPGTPHPRKRFDAVRKLNEAGIPTGVMIAPILPGISDSLLQLKAVVDAAIDAGATHITPILLHLRPVVREEYMGWLGQEYPGLVRRYEDLYKDNAYGPKSARRSLSGRINGLVRAAGGLKPIVNEPPERFVRKPPKEQPKQLQLL
jgi:DNA repair photolyase